MPRAKTSILANMGLALSFSSRIPLPCRKNAEIGKAFAWLPLAGIFLSLLALFPLFLPISNSWISAWFYVALMAWLTRGLHWDGLADVADGLGSNKTGAEFWKVVKDSKMGAVGGLCTAVAAAGYIIAAQGLIETGAWLALPWAAGLGRAFALLLPALSPASPDAALGQSLAEAEPFPEGIIWVLILTVLGICLFSFPAAACAAGLALLATWLLARKAKSMGGFNGDFVGAAIVLSELGALLAAACLA